MCAFITPLPLTHHASHRPLCARRPCISPLRVYVSLAAPADLNAPSSIPDNAPLHNPVPAAPKPPAAPTTEPTLLPPPSVFNADPHATYFTTCAACQAAYQLDPAVLGRGRLVACSVCQNEWFQKPDRLTVLKDNEVFKDYPMERKDQLMTESAQQKRERRRTAADRRPDRRFNDGRRQGGRSPRHGSGRRYDTFSAFIGNIPFVIDEHELSNFLEPYAKPTRLTIVKDEEGRSRGFAFAHFTTENEMRLVVDSLDGKMLGGRNLAVKVGKKNV